MTILPSPSLLNKINQFIQGEKFSLNYGLFLLSWKSGLRVSEAVSFDYQLKHPRHKNLYLVNGKGNKTRYVYVGKEIIRELKSNHWKPNQTNRFAFNNFLKKVKEKLNISQNIELTPHTLRRCFTTHNALKGVPIPILQKALGHKNIRTTSCYWKGSVDIREFGGWLEPDSDPERPDRVPKAEISPEIPIQPEITSPVSSPLEKDPAKPKLLLTIAELKRELEQKDLVIAEKNKQLKDRDNKIYLLTTENEKLKTINQEKDRQLKELQEKIKDLSIKDNSLIENYSTLKNTAENPSKNPVNTNQTQTKPFKEKNIRKFLLNSEENSPNALLKIKEPKNNSLATKDKPQSELIAEIQVWKPPN
jgi:Phage integrase family